MLDRIEFSDIFLFRVATFPLYQIIYPYTYSYYTVFFSELVHYQHDQ